MTYSYNVSDMIAFEAECINIVTHRVFSVLIVANNIFKAIDIAREYADSASIVKFKGIKELTQAVFTQSEEK
jgi:hypothetical protein